MIEGNGPVQLSLCSSEPSDQHVASTASQGAGPSFQWTISCWPPDQNKNHPADWSNTLLVIIIIITILKITIMNITTINTILTIITIHHQHFIVKSAALTQSDLVLIDAGCWQSVCQLLYLTNQSLTRTAARRLASSSWIFNSRSRLCENPQMLKCVWGPHSAGLTFTVVELQRQSVTSAFFF